EKIRSCAAGVSLAVAAGLLAGGASGLFSREQLLASSNMADTAQATRVRIRNPREGGGHLPGFNRGSALPVAQWDFGPDLRTPECSNGRTSSISAKKSPAEAGLSCSFCRGWHLADERLLKPLLQANQKSMPPMPPMPPPPWPPPIGSSFFGSSDTIASVVIMRPAMEAAFCSAVRVTLVGSRMPMASMSP